MSEASSPKPANGHRDHKIPNCDACGNKAEKLNSLCSGLGAVTFAYCDMCAHQGAEPYGFAKAMIEELGGPEAIRPDILEWQTYKDGKYMTIKDALSEEVKSE